MSDLLRSPDRPTGEHRIVFVDEVEFADATHGDAVVMWFQDPAPRCAVLLQSVPPGAGEAAGKPDADILAVDLLPLSATQGASPPWLEEAHAPSLPQTAPPVHVKYRGVDVWWRPGRAVLQCEPERAEELLRSLVEFAHYERELRRIEEEIAAAWPGVEEDKALAFEVSPAGLRRSETVGVRMQQAFGRRIRLARMEPHLHSPGAGLSAAAWKLGEELREHARIEDRAEVADGQMEVFEHIYEMSSQRIGEYRASRQAHIVEWIIIVLLAAEALLMLAQTIWKPRL